MADNVSLSELVAEEIRAQLARRKKSGRQLAAQLGVSQTWMSTRLSGATPIDLNDLDRIARAMGLDATDLLPRGGEGRLITTGGHSAGMGQITNARSTHLTDRAHLTGQPKRTAPSDATRRPARVHAPRTR